PQRTRRPRFASNAPPPHAAITMPGPLTPQVPGNWPLVGATLLIAELGTAIHESAGIEDGDVWAAIRRQRIIPLVISIPPVRLVEVDVLVDRRNDDEGVEVRDVAPAAKDAVGRG